MGGQKATLGGWLVGEPLFVSGCFSAIIVEASALLEIGIEGNSIGHAVEVKERRGITCLAAHGEWTSILIAIILYDFNFFLYEW